MLKRFFPLTVCCALLTLSSLSLLGQTSPRRTTAAREPVGKNELFQQIRAKLMLLPLSGSHINSASFDAETCVYTAKFSDGAKIENPLGSLDANAMHWSVGASNASGKYLVLEVLNQLKGQQITYVDADGKVFYRDFARFSFSLQGAAETPNFQGNFEKAVSRLITLCGGTPPANNH